MQKFAFRLEDNIFLLHEQLKNGEWKPDPYTDFFIRDPKLRHIHKATIRDRVFNLAVYRALYPIFDKHFIFDSYSCRNDKGTHRGVLRLDEFARKLSRNFTLPSYALKCDIRKFFDTISHDILFSLIKREVSDVRTLAIIELILSSFHTTEGKGLPLGNVTSQLFANVYMNELDQFIKHKLKIKYYIRYADDFVILSRSREELAELITKIDIFLANNLGLTLHPNKIHIRKLTQGMDFLGYVVLPHHKLLRTKTQNRILMKIKSLKALFILGVISKESFDCRLQSYLGMLTHCSGYKIKQKISILLS